MRRTIKVLMFPRKYPIFRRLTWLSYWKKSKANLISLACILVGAIIVTLVIRALLVNGTGFDASTVFTVSKATTIAHTTVTTIQAQQQGKTLWDWMQLLIVPLVLAVGGLLFNLALNSNAQKIASNNQQTGLLQDYFDRMSELIVDKHMLDDICSKPEIHTIAQARTLAVLSQLDANRKRSVILFLYNAGLLTAWRNGYIELTDADLREVDLSDTSLNEINLSKANLSGANLSNTFLLKADLKGANLSGADLSEAFLFEADFWEVSRKEAQFSHNRTYANIGRTNLSGANLQHAVLNEADLRGADLTNADLRKALLGKAKLNGAYLDGANLSNANLADTDLSRSHLNNVNLTDAVLTGANLLKATIDGANFSGVDLDSFYVSPEQIDKMKKG